MKPYGVTPFEALLQVRASRDDDKGLVMSGIQTTGPHAALAPLEPRQVAVQGDHGVVPPRVGGGGTVAVDQ